MLTIFEPLAKFSDWLCDWIGRGVAWLTLGMVLVTFAVVILRYFFDIGWIAMQESVLYMHGLVFLLGAAYTLQRDEHVLVDIFYREMSPKRKAVVNLLGNLLLLLPMFGFILWTSWDYVVASWELHETSRDAGGLPWIYLLKTSILVMGALLIVQSLSICLRNLITITTNSRHSNELAP